MYKFVGLVQIRAVEFDDNMFEHAEFVNEL